jgi:hypothetical protein
MSISASLEFAFSDSFEVTGLIHCLLDGGWVYDDHGSISYLPLGDDDSFDWRRSDLSSWSEVISLVDQKARSNELVGIVLTWRDTLIGGEFLFYPDLRSVSVCLTVNRKIINADCTDFSWYLEKINTPLTKGGYLLQKIVCEQLS